MLEHGKIVACKGNLITVETEKPIENEIREKRINSVGFCLNDGRTITRKQQKFIYALFKDMADHTGYTDFEIKAGFKKGFAEYSCLAPFSLADVDVTTARYFIDFLIQWCIENDVGTKISLLDNAPDIGRYVYLCLVNKKCAVCGDKAELHHAEHVQIGRNRKEICHIGMSALPLCRKHHTECHGIGQKSFNEKYHLFGVNIDENIAREYNLK